MEQATFPYDPVNRIKNLFYEYDFDDIPTFYNVNKLLKTKTKLIKYWKYCMEHVETALTPQIEMWDKQFADLTKELDELESNIKPKNKKNKTYNQLKLNNIRNVIKRRNDVRRHNQSVSLERELVHTMCTTLGLKIDCMVGQIRRIRKNYKKCKNCEKKAMITICECKLKHKICSECIDDKTECPVCKEDLGLQHCDICMLNKKEIVKTGCKNEHKTCKECLDKIKEKNNKCPFCREDLGRIHTLILYNVDGPPSVRTYTEDEWSSIEAQNPNVIDLDLNEHIDNRNRRPTVLPTEPEIQVERPGEVNISPRILDDVVANYMNNNPTFRQSSEEEYQHMLTNYHSTSHENPFIRQHRWLGRGRGRGGRGRIPTRNIYSREQAAELNDWTHYNEYQNWMESIGISDRNDGLPNDTGEAAVVVSGDEELLHNTGTEINSPSSTSSLLDTINNIIDDVDDDFPDWDEFNSPPSSPLGIQVHRP
jgi:hypothetical protein